MTARHADGEIGQQLLLVVQLMPERHVGPLRLAAHPIIAQNSRELSPHVDASTLRKPLEVAHEPPLLIPNPPTWIAKVLDALECVHQVLNCLAYLTVDPLKHLRAQLLLLARGGSRC